MTPQERLAMIKAAAEKRKAAKVPQTTPATAGSADGEKKKIELALKTINDYQRMRQDPSNIEDIIAGILSRPETDKSIKNYAQNYETKQKLQNRVKEIFGYVSQSPISPEHKEKYKSLLSQLQPFIDKLPNDIESPTTNIQTQPKADNAEENDDLMGDYEKEISTLRSQKANLERDIENILKTNKGQVIVGPLKVKVQDMKQNLAKVIDRLAKVEKELSSYKQSLITPPEPEVPKKSASDRDEWLATKKATKTPKKKETEPGEDDASAWLKKQGIDDTMLEQLNESSTVLLKTMAIKTGLPMGQLEKFWELAVKKNNLTNELRDSLFWTNVMKDFQKLINEVDIEEAKNIMETREQYKSEANNFLNAIASDDYINAQDAFKKMVASRLESNISDRAERYCQEVLSKEARKLANDL
jgi:hypothetical protein